NGSGPSFIVCETYRWKGHSKSDRNLYRTKEEIEEWKLKDPIKRFRTTLVDASVISEEEDELLQREAQARVDASVQFAEESPEPSIETIEEGVYAP
ncbi:MAG: hypothetical protein GTO14_26010, partial [Anaerolineales bacterium]|nr:hypothetical protein [Anaerolineales bacterium]